MQTNTRHLPATAPVHPSIPSGSQHRINAAPTTRPRTLPRQLVPGHSQDNLSQDNTGLQQFPRALSQDNSFQEYRTGQSPKTTRPRTTPGRTFQDNSSQDISTIYMVFQDNPSQDRIHYTTSPETHQ